MEKSSNSIMAMAVPAMSPRNTKTNDTGDTVGEEGNEVGDVKDVAQAWFTVRVKCST